ncbi:MAG: bifunctional riboflavin kinase/FAD synthetase [Lachnospiraceae bacterium]|nr:bifunctional riboflavin kinase/FAD synthetase [Lachnospiraceae bacterium]
MRIFSDFDEFHKEISESTAVAIGKFDGLHLGHARLFESVLSQKEKGLSTLVFTFDRQISDFFEHTESKQLTTNNEKEEYLRDNGFDYEFVLPVNEKTVAISPEDFVKALVNRLNAKYIAAGSDLSYGAGGKGDFALLRRLSKEYSFEVCEIEKVKLGNDVISSSMIRQYVAEGKMELAQAALGHPYTVDGIVTHGRMLGRKLEMPTVNMDVGKDKLLPPFGVYFSNIYLGTGIFHGITNIGVKPTVTDEGRVCVETYIYDFDDDLYGEWLRVELLHYLRSEMKFDGTDALKAQMRTDMLRGRIYFS